MAVSDTVVGIVGSIVLVAVMAGVFVYEYNNAPVAPVETPDPGNPTLTETNQCALGATGQNSCSFEFAPDAGGIGIEFDVVFDATAPGLPVGPTSQYTVTILAPDGSEVVTSTGTGSWHHELESFMEGTYTVQLSLPSGSAGGSFEVTALYAYPSQSEA